MESNENATHVYYFPFMFAVVMATGFKTLFLGDVIYRYT
jgi:hypothetical protein